MKQADGKGNITPIPLPAFPLRFPRPTVTRRFQAHVMSVEAETSEFKTKAQEGGHVPHRLHALWLRRALAQLGRPAPCSLTQCLAWSKREGHDPDVYKREEAEARRRFVASKWHWKTQAPSARGPGLAPQISLRGGRRGGLSGCRPAKTKIAASKDEVSPAHLEAAKPTVRAE